jgi:tetrahydromethanopterin S-methyltransferase subunit F
MSKNNVDTLINNLIISSFLFKMRDVRLFLSLEHSEAIVGLLIGLISILLCLR